jgi:folate-binding protein YgfZ
MIDENAGWIGEYQALRSAVGFVDLSDWSHVELQGDDRAKFLHNLSTNDIKGLAPGAGCEAFLLNAQGKILFHVLVFSGPDSLVLLTVPGDADRLTGHLDRYLIREQVVIHNRTGDWSAILISGTKAANCIEKLTGAQPLAPLYSSVETQVAGKPVWLRRVDIASAGDWLIHCRRADAEAVRASIAAAGGQRCGAEAFDSARIENGFPLYGLDITDQNLPQEVGRDECAIHFNKGCYLGQETVARIDALGHVNWKLSGLRFESSEVPAAETQLMHAEKVVGRITSAAYSPGLRAPVALGYVRREQASPGARLESQAGPARVAALPIQ